MILGLFNNATLLMEVIGDSFRKKLHRSRRPVSAVLLIIGMTGSVHAGKASPTGAATVGVTMALILSRFSGALNHMILVDRKMGAKVTLCMVAFILAGALILTVAEGLTDIPDALADWIGPPDLSAFSLTIAPTLLVVLIDCFLDESFVVVLTESVIKPMILQAEIDPLLFGVLLVIIAEVSQITSPAGRNLLLPQFLIDSDIPRVSRATLTFFVLSIAALFVIVILHASAADLPDKM